MYSRWYNIAVVLLWFSTMTWLVMEKVLPSLLIGTPPDYKSILQAQQDEPPVGWEILWNGNHRVGWAIGRTIRLPDGLTEVRNLVRIEDLKQVARSSPGWLQKLLRIDDFAGGLQIEARSVLVFDSLGHVSRFRSTIGTPEAAVVKVEGVIDGAELRLAVHYGEVKPFETTLQVGNALLNDSISPQSRLPSLREGQEWTVEMYSPLRRNDPREILQARVESVAPIQWNGSPVKTWVVVYRGDPGSALGGTDDVRGRMWVDRDGTVLRQQAMLLGSALTFDRLPPDQAAAMIERHRDRLMKDQILAPLPFTGRTP